MSYKFIFVIIILTVLILSGCSDNPTSNGSSTIQSGTNTMPIDNGFDFSSGLVIDLEIEERDYSDNIDLTDFYITASVSPSGSTYLLIGSPIIINDQMTVDTPSIQIIDNIDFDEINEVPDVGYQNEYVTEQLSIGLMFAIKTQDYKYSILEITDITSGTMTDPASITFKWKYQSDGSRYLQWISYVILFWITK